MSQTPPFGTLVAHLGIEAVFTRHGQQLTCDNCAYRGKCQLTDRFRGVDIGCFGGVYLPKQEYMERKLTGELYDSV